MQAFLFCFNALVGLIRASSIGFPIHKAIEQQTYTNFKALLSVPEAATTIQEPPPALRYPRSHQGGPQRPGG